MDDARRVANHLARNLVGLRHARDLTQEALARAARVPRSTIANLESGAGNPSLTVLLKVAGALEDPLDELLASPRAKVRKWSSAEVSSMIRGRDVKLRPLVPEPVPGELLVVMELAAGASMRGVPHLPGTREYFTCLQGKVALSVAGERFDPGTGDVLAFPGNVPRHYQNPDSDRGALGVSVVVLAKTGI